MIQPLNLQILPDSLAPSIPSELDHGEREAIALALETGEQRILLDEREARQVGASHFLFSEQILIH